MFARRRTNGRSAIRIEAAWIGGYIRLILNIHCEIHNHDLFWSGVLRADAMPVPLSLHKYPSYIDCEVAPEICASLPL